MVSGGGHVLFLTMATAQKGNPDASTLQALPRCTSADIPLSGACYMVTPSMNGWGARTSHRGLAGGSKYKYVLNDKMPE